MASEQASGPEVTPARQPTQAIRTIQQYLARCTQCEWAGNLPREARVHVLLDGHTVKESRETQLEPVF